MQGTCLIQEYGRCPFLSFNIRRSHKKLEIFLEFCKKKNLKLKPSKFCIGEEVEFGGTLITSETVGSKNVVNILPKSQRVQAFQNLRRPRTRKEVKIFCGMMTSLMKWSPNAPLNAPV